MADKDTTVATNNGSTSSSGGGGGGETEAQPLTPVLSLSSSNGDASSLHTPTVSVSSSSAPKLIQTPTTIKRVRQVLNDFNEQKLKGEELRRAFGSCLASLVARSASDPNCKDIFADFLREGADPDGGDSELSPLYVATDLRDREAVKALLSHGASVLRLNKNKTADFPLAIAFNDPYSDVARLFLDHIADLERLRFHAAARKRLNANFRDDDEDDGADDLAPPRKRKRSEIEDPDDLE